MNDTTSSFLPFSYILFSSVLVVMDIEEEILHLMIFFSFHTPQELDLNSSIHLSPFQPLLRGIPRANFFSPLLSLLINLKED